MEENNMQNILINLYNRCQAIRLRNYLNPKLEAFDLLLCFRSVCKQLDSILNDLTYYLPFDSSVFIDYSKWYNCFSAIETLDIRDFYSIVTTEPKHIVDFLFPGSMIDSNRESAEEIRRAIEILTSDIYMKGENLVNSLFYAKMELLNRLLTLDKELKKRKSPEFRIKMINNLFYHYTSYDGNGNIIGKFVDDFEDWKDKCLDLDNDMLETYLWTMVYNLLKKKFLIIDKDNYVKNKANAFFEETKFDLVDGDELDEDDLKKKYYVLRNLLDYENGRFVLKKKEILGKYLLSHNKDISLEDFLEFKYFLDTIELIYGEMADNNDNLQYESVDVISNDQNDTYYDESEYNEVIKKVFTESIIAEDNTELDTIEQVKKTWKLVNSTSNVEIGMFKIVCEEAGALVGMPSDHNYVKALIGLGFIPKDKKIKNVIEGYRKKIYGEQDKNGNYIKKRLPDKHNEWKGRNKTFGNKIFNSLKNR